MTASPPEMRPRLIDGRSNSSEDSRAKGIDSMRRKTSIALSTALSPSHGVEPWAARPETSTRIISTPLAWTPMWRSVGSPVIAKSPRSSPEATSSSVERTSTSSDSSSGTITSCHARAAELVQVVQRAEHRRQAALHVVGAAADQPVALDARLELLRAPGHDVEVPVQDDQRAGAGADLGRR